MSKTIEEILAPKPEVRPPRIYAYSIADEAHKGLLKIGQTTRDVKQRIAEQLKTAAIKNFRIELDESAERDDGDIFSDYEVRAALARKGFENAELEWMRCAVKDVKTVLTELRTGLRFTGTHHQTFPMRREQAEAVKVTHGYFLSRWTEDMHAVPRFLWNAKMRGRRTLRVTWTSTAGSTSRATPTATRAKSPSGSRSSISALFRICWAVTQRGTLSPRTNGSTRSIGTS
jgi:hypothetical protein